MPRSAFNQSILNALSAQIAILDPDGRIDIVNDAWRRFGAENGLRANDFAIGMNYLTVCDGAQGHHSDEAAKMAAGIRAVLHGERALFELEYSCHSPSRLSWFRASVTPVWLDNSRCALVIHIDITERVLAEQTVKQAEGEQRALAEALAQERERLKIAQSVAKLGSWEMNLQTSKMMWSDEACKIYGMDRETLSSSRDGLFSFLHPDDKSIVERAFEASLTKRDVMSVDVRLLLPDDTIKHINSTWQTFADENSVPVKAIGACQDISERQVAKEKLLEGEAELRQSRLHLEIAQRVASIGSAAIDFRTGKWDWSDENFRIYGLEPGAIIPSAETLGSLVHPEDRAGLLANIPLAKSGITPPPLEYRIIRPDGVERLLRREASLVRDGTGNVIGIVGAVQDVTEFRAAQRAKEKADNQLKEQAALLSNAQRIGRMGSWGINLLDGKLTWSDATCELFGITPDEFQETFEHFVSFIVPEDMPTYREAHSRVTPDRPLLEAQYRIRRPDGEVRWMHERGNVTFDDAGSAVARIGMVSDVTELRNLEIQLRDTVRLEAIGQLTGGLAHDFNNLLTVILGNAEALSVGVRHDRELYNLAQMTLQAAERGAELTRRLLAFARRQPLAPRITDINKLLGDMKALLRRTIEGNIDIEWEFDEKLGFALIDAPQLESAVLNLCINARDAMPDGGRLTIKSQNVYIENGRSGLDRELLPGAYVEISVSDTGCGMNQETLARVFEPFFTTKGFGKGSGLGLSMAYGFIKQSNGQIFIESTLGKGTKATLYLPMAFDSPEIDACDAIEEDLPGGHERILMVEDDLLVRHHVSGMLKRLGYDVTEASNGAEAVKALESDRNFSLLFSDILLPGNLNGRELARLAVNIRPELAVLMTTGYAEHLLNNHTNNDHDIQLLRKPYRINELATMIRHALGAKAKMNC